MKNSSQFKQISKTQMQIPNKPGSKELLKTASEEQEKPPRTVVSISTDSVKVTKTKYISCSEAPGKTNLKDEDYYHGFIPYIAALDKLKRNGDFLVKRFANTSNTESYAIAVMHENNKRNLKVHYSKSNKLYFMTKFSFNTLPALLAFHRRNRLPVDTEGAILLRPIPRDKWLLSEENIKRRRGIGSETSGGIYMGTLNLGLFSKINVAVKLYNSPLTCLESERLQQEAEVLSRLDHPNLLKFYGVALFESPVAVVIELALGGSVLDAVQSLPGPTEEKRRNFIIGVSKGLEYLEKRSIINRSVEARKCYIGDKGLVKMTDFGLTIFGYDLKDMKKKTVPIRHLSPEVLQKGRFTPKSTVWSFGVLIWEIFNNGKKPYEDIHDLPAVQDAIIGGKRLDNSSGKIPTDLYPICTQCFRIHPSDRPGFETIVQMLTT